jgi:hypothetical protein
MTTDTHIDEVTKTDLKHVFNEIREDVEKATSRQELDELYKRTAYMILMTHATPLEDKTDREMGRRREITERDFARTVRLINQQAKKIGTEANYNEKWEELSTNGYEADSDSLLEPQDRNERPKRINE